MTEDESAFSVVSAIKMSGLCLHWMEASGTVLMSTLQPVKHCAVLASNAVATISGVVERAIANESGCAPAATSKAQECLLKLRREFGKL